MPLLGFEEHIETFFKFLLTPGLFKTSYSPALQARLNFYAVILVNLFQGKFLKYFLTNPKIYTMMLLVT
jgi:hypothetical protein